MSKNDESVYAITDLEGYAREMRDAAASTFSDDYSDIDSYINVHQMMNLVKSECIGFDDNNRPLLNEDANEKIYESTITWIHNVGLSKLAAQGLIECAWDTKSNEMVFWANSKLDDFLKTEEEKEKSDGKPVKRRNKKKNKGS